VAWVDVLDRGDNNGSAAPSGGRNRDVISFAVARPR